MNLPKPPVDLDIWLDKISLLHQNLARDPNPLDADLLKRYVRSYYEALLAWERGEERASGGPVGVREAMAELRQVPPLAPFGPSAEGRAPAAPPAAGPTFAPPAPAAPPSPDVVPPAPPSPDVVPPVPAAPAPSAPAPAPTPIPPVQAPTPAPIPPVQAPTPAPPVPTPAPPVPTPAPPAPPTPAAEEPPSPAADEPAAAEEPSLNDRFARPDAPRPLHAAAANPAEDLRRIIDINERALFTRELFGGNSEAYGSAVRALNDFAGLAQAEAYIDRELAPRFSWPAMSRVVDHFRDLVRQRYGA
jgi:outer membrane biosynthesis protein TonB